MNPMLETAHHYGVLPEGFTEASGDAALAAAEDANEALFAWGCAQAKARTPRGYVRPEHAFAVAYALGCFYLTCARPGEIDFDALSACRVHYLGHLSIDQTAEDAAERQLYEELIHRAADIALHGREPGAGLVKRLMTHSLTGLLELSDDTPEKTAALALLDSAVSALDRAGMAE